MNGIPRTLTAPAAPGSAATITLYEHGNETVVPSQRPLRVLINFLSISHASGTNGFVAEARTTPTGTWRAVDFSSTMPATIAASSAGVDDIHDFDVSTYKHFRITYTNSANVLTTWEIEVTQLFGVRDIGR